MVGMLAGMAVLHFFSGEPGLPQPCADMHASMLMFDCQIGSNRSLRYLTLQRRKRCSHMGSIPDPDMWAHLCQHQGHARPAAGLAESPTPAAACAASRAPGVHHGF